MCKKYPIAYPWYVTLLLEISQYYMAVNPKEGVNLHE